MSGEMRAPFEITRHEPPHRQGIYTTGGPIRPDGILSCEQQGDGTLISYEFSSLVRWAGSLRGLSVAG